MEHSILDTLETSYYAIFENLEYVEVIDLQTAFKQNPKPIFAIKKENYTKSYSLYNENFISHSKYTLYNIDMSEYLVQESNWKLLNINERVGWCRETLYTISDPNQVSKVISSKILSNGLDYYQIEGIIKIIKLLKDLSKYDSWEQSGYDKTKDTSPPPLPPPVEWF